MTTKYLGSRWLQSTRGIPIHVRTRTSLPAGDQRARRRSASRRPKPADAFKAFSKSVFAEGALTVKTKQLIAVAVAHVTQCPYCIRGHTAPPSNRGRRRRKSWKPSGSPPRCAMRRRLRTLGSGTRHNCGRQKQEKRAIVNASASAPNMGIRMKNGGREN